MTDARSKRNINRGRKKISNVTKPIQKGEKGLEPLGLDEMADLRNSVPPEGSGLVHDEGTIWKSTLERSNKRINALTDQAQSLERINQIKGGEISSLQAVVARLKDENLNLERSFNELVRENETLRISNDQNTREVRSLVRSINRQQNDHFWSVCHFIAGADEFQAFATSVNYDLTRLFAMLLASEIREDSDLAPGIKTHAAAIAHIFDPFFYLTEYQEIALAGVNPLLDYVTQGYKEKRRPSLLFDNDYYSERAKLRSRDPLLHYAEKGAAAGLKPHPLFDGKFYLEQYPDIAAKGLNPLFHYQTYGGRERRNPSPLFDAEHFLETGSFSTFVNNPLQEYLMGTAQQQGDPHPLFHSRYFRERASLEVAQEPLLVLYEKQSAHNRHVAPHPLFDLDFMQNRRGVVFDPELSPLESFCRMSRERDIDPSILFDSKLYRFQVEIEKKQSLEDPPIIDYLKHGYRDKTLLPNIAFNPDVYLNRNRIKISEPELTHYCLEGDQAGFFTHSLFCAKVYNAQRGEHASPETALEHFLSAPSKGLVSHPHVGRALSSEVIDFVRRACDNDEEFDCEFYQELHPDLAELSKEDARSHYEADGRREGRLASARAVLQKSNLLLRDVPLGFFPDEYLYFNPDLSVIGSSFLPLLGHYLQYGRLEQRTIGRWQFYLDTLELNMPSRSAPLAVTQDSARIEVGVLMHIFYPDLWPELAAFAGNFNSISRDVFVNVVDIAWTPKFQTELRELCPGAFIQLSNDDGRDIGGFIRLLDNVDIQKYDLFAWMHSKKSPHIAAEKGEYWRRSLLNAFAGSQETVAECVQLFRDDPSVGLIGAESWRSTDMGKNEEGFLKMLDLFEIEEQHRSLEYLSGTMFLMRSSIVQRLYDGLKSLEWEYGGDKDLSFHTDGQIAHAVERIVGNLTRQMGYRMVWR